MMERLFSAGLCFVTLLLLLSCGGGGKEPNLLERPEDSGKFPELPVVYAYVPFVESVEIPEAATAGQVFQVQFEINTSGLPETALHVLNTSSEPITPDHALVDLGGLVLYLEPLTAGTIPYDGSGRIRFDVLVESPGQYELVYGAATSFSDAGIYELGDPNIAEHTRLFTVALVVEE